MHFAMDCNPVAMFVNLDSMVQNGRPLAQADVISHKQIPAMDTSRFKKDHAEKLDL